MKRSLRFALASIALFAVCRCLSAATSVTILKPAAGDTVAIGGNDTVKFWTSTKVLLTPEVSVDNGKNWFSVFPPDMMGCVTGEDSSKWIWKVNQEDLKTGGAMFRFVGYMDPAINVQSGKFYLSTKSTPAANRPANRAGSFTVPRAVEVKLWPDRIDKAWSVPMISLNGRCVRRCSLTEGSAASISFIQNR